MPFEEKEAVAETEPVEESEPVDEAETFEEAETSVEAETTVEGETPQKSETPEEAESYESFEETGSEFVPAVALEDITDEDRLIATAMLMYMKMIKDKVESDAQNAGV